MSDGSIAFIDLAAQQARIRESLDAALARVLDHGKYVMGPEVAALESQLGDFSGAGHVVSCASGTDALLMILMAWDVGAGDAVFVPAFTFVATAEVVSLLGATPVFVDVDERTYLMDPASLEDAVAGAMSSGLKPAAVVPVDLFGQPADYEAIGRIATEHGLRVLADAAQSFGATRGGRRVGTFGDATATSFFPAKPLGCYGDGGAIFVEDEAVAQRLRSVRVHGQGAHKYDNVRVGLNGRLDTVQAAVLIEKLRIFADEVALRDRVAERYDAALHNRVRTPELDDGTTSVWAQYTVQVDDRDRFAARLKESGVPSAVYYPKPLHRHAPYRDCPAPAAGLPVSERVCERVISLPMHPYLDPATQDRIVSAVDAALR